MAVKKKSKRSAALGTVVGKGPPADAIGTGKAKKRRKLQDSESVGAHVAPPLKDDATAERGKKRKKAKGKAAGLVDETSALPPKEDATAERGKKRKKAKGKAAGLVGETSRLPDEDQGPVELVETAAPPRLLAFGRSQGEEEEEELELVAPEQKAARLKKKAEKQQQRKGKVVQHTELSENAAILESVMQKKKGGDADSDSDSLRGADFIPTPGTQDREDCLKVFVGGLFWKLDAEKVRKDFEECGKIISFEMPRGKSGEAMGIAFIVYKTQQGVDNALSFDGDDYHGRTLNVKLSNPPKGKGRGSGKGEGKSKGKGKGGKDKGKGKDKGDKGKGDKGKGKGKSKAEWHSRFE